MSSLLQIPTFINHGNVIAFDQRPFASVEEMNEKMRKRWNGRVGARDRVYILGDFIWLDPDDPRYIEFTRSLNGKKVLICGNHDAPENFSGKLAKCFEEITYYKEIKKDKKTIIMSHFPIAFYKRDMVPSYYHFFGHLHNTQENALMNVFIRMLVSNSGEGRPTGHMINVGACMPYMSYTPQPMDTIIEAGKERFGFE